MISGWIVLIHTHLRDNEKETQLALPVEKQAWVLTQS
jgi:hypothetical protein